MKPCIIVDIDGTLAHKGDRSPFHWERVGEDLPNVPIIRLLECIQESCEDGLVTILMSGRDSVCRPETEEWLRVHHIKYDHLFMRPEGNTEKDSIIKKRLYEENIKDKYSVWLVLDDRNQVVEMWRSEGLICLQVADGNF